MYLNFLYPLHAIVHKHIHSICNILFNKHTRQQDISLIILIIIKKKGVVPDMYHQQYTKGNMDH